MTMQLRKRTAQPSSCPPGHVPAGHVVPLSLTVRQLAYCRRAVGVSKLVYNLCVATHQFYRANRLPWPSWPDRNQAVNETKQHEFPFLAEVSHRMVDGAVRNFSNAIANWRDPKLRARKPTFKPKQEKLRSGSIVAS